MKRNLILTVLFSLLTFTVNAENSLSASSTSGRLIISMENDVVVTAYDFHLYLPENASIAQYYDEEEEMDVVDVEMSRTKKSHALVVKTDALDQSFLFGVSSPSSATLKDSSGEILSIGLDLSTVADGTYNCAIKKIFFAISGTEGVKASDVEFEIVVQDGKLVSATTGIDGVVADKGFNGDGKYLKDGKIIIKKGNKEYNAVGGIMK